MQNFASSLISDYITIIAELSRARGATIGASSVRKFGYLYTQQILVLTKSFVRVRPYVRSPLHVSGCEMAHFNTGYLIITSRDFNSANLKKVPRKLKTRNLVT